MLRERIIEDLKIMSELTTLLLLPNTKLFTAQKLNSTIFNTFLFMELNTTLSNVMQKLPRHEQGSFLACILFKLFAKQLFYEVIL